MRYIVNVVLKKEVLDPQGQAIERIFSQHGIVGAKVRQGKHFVIDVEDTVSLKAIEKLAQDVLSNPVIEDFSVESV